MQYVIPQGKTSSGINFRPLFSSVIEGTFRLNSDCLYDIDTLTPREATSWNKIVGIGNLFSFNSNNARIGFRMKLDGTQIFEAGSYIHDKGPYDTIKNPARHICYFEPDEDHYFRVEDHDKWYKLTVKDQTVIHEKSTNKFLMRAMMFPYVEMGDKPAPHNMTFNISLK